MKIAELFVNLGLVGNDKTNKGLRETDKGLDAVASKGLAAKAAIVGIVYGLEQLTGFAARSGADLMSFKEAFDLSPEDLQRWQNAGRTFNVSAQEMTSTIGALRKQIVGMRFGEAPPEGLFQLAQGLNEVGESLDETKLENTFYLMERMQKFAQTHGSEQNLFVLGKMGLSPNMIAMLKQVNLETMALDKNISSMAQIEKLNRLNQQWEKFWITTEMIGKGLAADYGGKALSEIQHAAHGVELLSKGLEKVIDKGTQLKVLLVGGLAAAVNAAFGPIGLIVTGITAVLADMDKFQRGQKSVGGDVFKWGEKNVPSWLKGLDFTGAPAAASGVPLAVPGLRNAPQPAAPSNVTMHNVFHIDGSKSPESTADAIQEMLSNTRYQMSTQAEGGG